jgi:hypothetical protein
VILLDTNIYIINARPAAVLQRFRQYRMGDIGLGGCWPTATGKVPPASAPNCWKKAWQCPTTPEQSG